MHVWNVLQRGSLQIQDAKNRHFGTIAQLCRAISSQLRHISTIGKKLFKQQYVLHMSAQYGELRPTSGWDRFANLRHSSKFQRVSPLAFVTAATSLTEDQPNFAQCLAVSWAGKLYIHFRGFLPPDWILSGAKFTLRPSLAFAYMYIGNGTARHTSSGRQPNFAALNRGRHLYSAARPSRWALAHILVIFNFVVLSVRYTQWTIKSDILFLTITLASLDRFL